ncbi:MAG: hypothetical protein AB7F35_00815 [Acetobacteraceae bacterium]
MTVLTFSKPPSTNNLFGTNWKTRQRFVSEEYKRWRKMAMQEIMTQRRHQHPGRVRVAYAVERGSPLSDIGNREKGPSDLLVEMGIIKNDNLIESIYLNWSDKVKGIRARITDCI